MQHWLACLRCGTPADDRPFGLCHRCAEPLAVRHEPSTDRAARLRAAAAADRRSPILLRWAAVLGLEQPGLVGRVSLGERETPLVSAPSIAAAARLGSLRLKCESELPNGSLKDRSMPLVVVRALERGYRTVAITSSGNAATSLAAYAERAGLACVAFVGSTVPAARLERPRRHGATVVRVAGAWADVVATFARLRDRLGWYDCNGGINPWRLEGQKTVAYEIAAALEWRAPEWICVPAGSGTGLAALGQGFQELYDAGVVPTMPRLVAAQPAACAPLHTALQEGGDDVPPTTAGRTVAQALVNETPENGRAALGWIRRTGGTAAALEDDEITDAVRCLAVEDVPSEPAGAVSVAAARRLAREGVIESGASVVAVVTGHARNLPSGDTAQGDILPELAADDGQIMEYLDARPGR